MYDTLQVGDMAWPLVLNMFWCVAVRCARFARLVIVGDWSFGGRLVDLALASIRIKGSRFSRPWLGIYNGLRGYLGAPI